MWQIQPDTPPARRTSWRFTLVAALAIVFLGVPMPDTRHVPAIIEYSPKIVVRAGTDGFVDRIHIKAGQIVATGDMLVELRNPKLQTELTRLDLEIQQANLKASALRSRREMAAYQAEMKGIEDLQQRRREKLAQVEQLVVRAPGSGKVVSRCLDWHLGTYFHEGDEIIRIGDEQKKEVVASVSQSELDSFSQFIGCHVRIQVSGRDPFSATLSRVSPRATTLLPHPALAAINGGPLAVMRPDRKSNQANDGGEVQLINPRFRATLPLNEQQSTALRAGRRARISLSAETSPLGARLLRTALLKVGIMHLVEPALPMQ
jgi:putative peptide zinc metalloprotease protein